MVQVVASGLIFGVGHAVWAVGHPLRFFAFPVIYTSLLGFALATIYVYSGRKLAPAIYCHALIDIVIEPGLAISAFHLTS